MTINIKSSRNDTFLIKVYSYDGKQIIGKLFDVFHNKYYEYQNLIQLIMIVDDIVNNENSMIAEKGDLFNSACKEGRFEMIAGEKSWLLDKHRLLSTFKLKICFMEFDTWQGELWSIDTGKMSAFRNFLELTILMDDELEMARNTGGLEQ